MPGGGKGGCSDLVTKPPPRNGSGLARRRIPYRRAVRTPTLNPALRIYQGWVGVKRIGARYGMMGAVTKSNKGGEDMESILSLAGIIIGTCIGFYFVAKAIRF